MCAELALLGLALNYGFISAFLGLPAGQMYTLLILVAAAAESSIGLALVVLWYKATESIDILKVSKLRS